MDIYNSFAQVYDKFMEETPYEQWADYIEQIFEKYNYKPKLVLDLGCGTGNITTLLAKKGIEMIGIDISEDMLGIAKQKAENKKLDILYLNQDMREFELYGTVDCIISICDSINYLLEEEELLKTFKLVNNYLEPKGLYVFDINTEYKYQQILGTNTFAETFEDSAYIWENYYYDDEKINEYSLTFFVQQADKDIYKRFQEFHYQKAYSVFIIKKLLEKAGLKLLNVYDAFTFNKPNIDSERIYFVAQEMMK